MSKTSLAVTGIGVIGITGAIFLATNNNTAQSGLKQSGSNTNNPDSHQVLGDQSIQGDSTLTAQDTNPSDANSGNAAGPQQSAPNAVNGVTGGANSNTNKPPASSPPSTSTPSRTGYNLNENWYLATAGAEGLYNSCWPTELNESNEAQCVDESNPYSHFWFEGIGISKSPEEAGALASAQVNQKAYEKHVDLRRGGGDDPVILTESLCSSYGLECSRW